jgi:hypothetical protein
MKTLLNVRDRTEVLDRLANLRPDAQRKWGKMTAHQMICHLSDSLRAAMREKQVSPATSLFNRKVVKPLALWIPIPWPRGYKTRPELDQQQDGTTPVQFSSDVEVLHMLFERFCSLNGEYAPHPMFGQLSKSERMRHGYLHFDHHLRQFGV